MLLKQVIKVLEGYPENWRVRVGFKRPHSYRGYYERLAFEPASDVTIGEMLACARAAVGQTYQGLKGGDYTMDEYTEVYLSQWGNTGYQLSPPLFLFMLDQGSSAWAVLEAWADNRDRWWEARG